MRLFRVGGAAVHQLQPALPHRPRAQDGGAAYLRAPTDTLHGIDSQAIRKTGLCVLPGKVLGKPGLLLSTQIKDGGPAPKTMPFKPALAQIISNQKKIGDLFLPVLMKGDLREFDQQMPYIHLHRLQLARLERLSSFERDDIQQTITRKLLMLHRQADSLVC
ncbi:hypothetical protein ACSMFT_07515 [Ectopseudomonas oleovorans]|uniref:hypothetical protein n=1 Tax=Ectopseudomonas oleovorans TaxID=301 RepID=UPI003F19D95B